MRLTHFTYFIVTIALAAPVVRAQNVTYVSGTGDDANPCSRPAPCRTFAGAISKTVAGGEIDALDTAGFGILTITKSITIDAGHFIGGVLASNSNGININAGASGVVILRSLDIDGFNGTGLNGINITSAATVRIENTRIYGFSQDGIHVVPNAGPVSLTATNSSIRDGGGPTSNAITADGTAVGVNIVLEDVQIHGYATAVSATTGSDVFARNFDFCSNTTGVAAAGNATVDLDTGLIAYTTTAVQAAGTSTIRLTNASILDNGTGLSTSGGAIVSFNNNRIKGNTTDGNPSTTYFQR